MVKICLQSRGGRRCRFNPWVGKMLWRRKWQPIPVFLPGESHGQRSLAVHRVAKSQTQLKRLSMVFPVVMYRCESLTIEKAANKRTDTLELWCWRRLLRVPWAARRPNQSILKETNPEYSLEGLMLKLKLQYFGHLSQLIDKDPDAGKD